MHHKERCILKRNICNFVGLLTIGTLVFGATPGLAAGPSNPRGASSDTTVRAKTATESGATRHSSNNVVLRNVTIRGGMPGRVSARGAVTSNTARSGASVARTGVSSASVSRSASSQSVNTVENPNRSAINAGASRSALSRATAIFSDVSKIGGGYANCRDAYATCMDQFCANANDKYRRCFCSSRFTEFRDTEEAMDQAKTLLMQFEDNNLNAVDKTAAEVNAMYSATIGEAAIKKDTSGAAKILDEIGDLLSGKKSAKKNSNASMGIISVDTLTGDIDDIWGDTGGSVFESRTVEQNLADLEGESLYNASNRQCVAMIAENCSSDAVLQMARSSYSIMITQDCNTYEKQIDKQRENVKQAVRTAEKYLRDARLEEYRSHNSADVNECIQRVKTAITADVACGENYKHCLDNTGAYINATTGEAIYTPRLYKLTELITLTGDVNSDVLSYNQSFNSFLDSKRIHAATALDSCRDIADTVWTEFKRSALIEIAQAQDEKIESVKMSCVGTMKQCYDNIGGQIKDFDDTTAKAAGATGVYAAKAMCMEKVSACAALYGNGTPCNFDNSGKLQNTTACGLTALLDFVDSVDDTRVAEACDTAVDSYLTELCTPTSGSYKYPYGCRSLNVGDPAVYQKVLAGDTVPSDDSIWAQVSRFVYTNCATKSTASDGKQVASVDPSVTNKIVTKINNLAYDMGVILSDVCESTYDGIWTQVGSDLSKEQLAILKQTNMSYVTGFYTSVFGGNTPNMTSGGIVTGSGSTWGICIPNSIEQQCEAQDLVYNATTGKCDFTTEWYQNRCDLIGGYWEDGSCYTE